MLTFLFIAAIIALVFMPLREPSAPRKGTVTVIKPAREESAAWSTNYRKRDIR